MRSKTSWFLLGAVVMLLLGAAAPMLYIKVQSGVANALTITNGTALGNFNGSNFNASTTVTGATVVATSANITGTATGATFIATSGNITGTITGATVTATSANITGTATGATFTATSANITGTITGATVTVTSGNISGTITSATDRATSGQFSGTITGATVNATSGNYSNLLSTNIMAQAGGSSSNVFVGGTLFYSLANFTNLNGTPTTFTNLGNYSLPGHTITNNGDRVYSEWGGQLANNLANTNEFKVTWGGTVVLDTGLVISSNTTFQCWLRVVRSGTSAQHVESEFWFGSNAYARTTTNLEMTINAGVAQTIALQGASQRVGAHTNNSFFVEFKPGPR